MQEKNIMFIKQVKMNKKLQQSCLSVLLLFIIIILTCSKALHAAVHYVSPSGSASWGQSSDTASPCSTACAFANAHAGDTVYFRGGTYNVPPKNILDTYHESGSRTQRPKVGDFYVFIFAT